MSFIKPRNIQNVLSRQNWNRFTQRKLVAPFHRRTSLKLDRALKMATSSRLEETIQNQCWIQVHNLGTQDLHGSLLVMETWLVPYICNKEASQLMAYMTQQGFEIPKRELLNFNGNPYKYWLFRNNFEVNIAKRVPDTKMSLTYLIQHCAGKVRKPLRTVLLFLYQNKNIYRKAKEILYHRIGQKHNFCLRNVTVVMKGIGGHNTIVAIRFWILVRMLRYATWI